MSDAKPTDENTPRKSQVFRYVRHACRKADGTILMGASIYDGGSHMSAQIEIEPERSDYPFWLWLILRVRERDDETPFLSSEEVEKERTEYANLVTLHGASLIDPTIEIEKLALVREKSQEEMDREAKEIKDLLSLNPFVFLRVQWQIWRDGRKSRL